MSLIEQVRPIFNECSTRNEFVARTQKEVGLSRAGANTYWQHFMTEGRAAHNPALIGRSNGNKPNTSGMFGQSPAVGLALFTAIF